MFAKLLVFFLALWVFVRVVRTLWMALWDGQVRDTRRSKIRRTSRLDLDASQIEEAEFEEIEE